ncbi:MAG: Ig-like domain-containing protein, partial [Methylococcales bacterium]|nr:Ig-like domain-containing protein [Methylococcales bacterium]
STSQPVKGVTTITPSTGTTETNALTTSLRYTTGSVPPLNENTITVTENNTLRIFATFNQPIQHATIPVININNGSNDLIRNASMTRVSDLTYYYDLDVPTGDFTGNVSVQTQSLTTGKVFFVKTSNTTFAVDNAPAISSGDTVLAISENSGENQVVYKATSNDSSAVYTLKDTADRAFFSIETRTGVVTLKGNPDFELKDSYSFTVIVSDASGNVNRKSITLTIKNVDEISPTIKTVSSTVEDGSYKVGDVLPITVEFDEIVNVTGSPTLTLKIGAIERVVNYSAGAGTTTLTFNYKIQTADSTTDLGYISTAALKLNGATISDPSGNKAIITLSAPNAEGSLAASKDITIDNVAPTLSSLTPSNNATDVVIGSDVVLTFDEAIKLGKGKVTLSSGNDIKIFDVTDNAGQFSIDGKVLTLNPPKDLEHGLATYKVVVDAGAIVDLASNPYVGISTTFKTAINTNVVIFDLTTGKNSAHSDRDFKIDVDYKIYLKVDHDSANVAEPPTKWTGGENLGAGDLITLVGDGGGKVLGTLKNGVLSNGKASKLNTKIEWATAVQTGEGNAQIGNAFVLKKAGFGSRSYSNAQNNIQVWTGGANLELIGKAYNTNILQNLMQTQNLL